MKKNQHDCEGCGAPLSDSDMEEIKQRQEDFEHFSNELAVLVTKYKFSPAEKYRFSLAVALATITTQFGCQWTGLAVFQNALFEELMSEGGDE